LLGSLEFAYFQRSIDCDDSIVKSLNQRWVSLLENNLRVAYRPRGDPGEIGNLFSHVNVLSFWQICQTLVLAASDLVGKSLRLEIRFLLKCQFGSSEVIPDSSRPLQGQDQLQRFVSAQCKFDANNLSLPCTYRGVPLCETGEENALVSY